MKTTVKTISHFMLFLFTSVMSMSLYAELTATVDRSVLDSNETLRLEVRYNAQLFRGEPDFTALESDFEVLSNNQQRSYSSINGKTESFTAWTLQLRPKRAGIIIIPSFNFKGDVSNAIELRVRAAPANASANPGSQPIYAETLVDESKVYTNQQVLLTQRLYTSVNLRDFSLSELEVENALLYRLGDTTYQKVINGRNYLVLEVKYALFPQQAGSLVIPKLRFGAFEVASRSQFGVFNNRGNQIIRDTESKTVDVQPPPNNLNSAEWLPSSKVSLQQRWSGERDSVVVGEPITRTITITAEGQSASQITPLELSNNGAYRSYPDQPQLDQSLTDAGLVSTRKESIALVPNKPGEITLPAIELRWWNTQRQQEEIARLPETTLMVMPAPDTPSDPISSNDSSVVQMTTDQPKDSVKQTSDELSIITSVSLLLNGVLIILLSLILYRKKVSPSTEQGVIAAKTPARLILKQHFKAIELQSKAGNLSAVREAILQWAATLYAENPPQTLKALSMRLQDPIIEEQFNQLDRHLYRPNEVNPDELNLSPLLEALAKHSTFSGKEESRASSGRSLQELYPYQK
jgi:hypothetical protein